MNKETIIAYEGRATEDGRLITLDALYWKELPLPILKERYREGSWFPRIEVGTIVALERRGHTVWATMDVDLPEGYCLSLDGADAKIRCTGSEAIGVIKVVFESLRVIGGTLIPIEDWAWEVELDGQ